MTASLASLLALSLPSAAHADPSEEEEAFPCTGRWQGAGQNTGFDESWGIDLVVHAPDASGRCGSITYSNPRCGGHLVDCRRGPPVRVREAYTFDEGCAPAGGQEFSCDGDTMQWAWLGWEVARTTLRRVGSAEGGGAQATRTGAEAREVDAPGQPSLPPADRIPSPPPEPSPPPPPPSETQAPAESSAGPCGCRAVGQSPRSALPLGLPLLALVALRRRR